MPQYATHGFVGLNYKELYTKTFDPADINSFSAESLDLSYDEAVRDVDTDGVDAASVINDMLDGFVKNLPPHDDGSELTLVVSSCYCDYTADAITCDADFGEERGVSRFSILPLFSEAGDKPIYTVDINYSGLGTLAISTACSDKKGGQGPVSDTVVSSFDCYINNGFGQFYGGTGVSRYTTFFVL